MRFMGIDYGSKKVGVALSDESGTVAFPKMVLPNNAKLCNTVVTLCEREGIGTIVLGESKNFKGEDNAIMKDIRLFKDAVADRSTIPIHFEQEFLTSAGAGRGEGDDEMRDARAAALILQRYLDRNNHSSRK